MRKRTLTTAAAAAALVGALGFAAPPAFAVGYGNVSASTSGDTVSIGNDAISRTFNIAGNKLKTGVIDNKLGNTKLTPGDGSEEFYIEGLAEQVRQEPENALTSVKPSVGTTVSSVSEMGGRAFCRRKCHRWQPRQLLEFCRGRRRPAVVRA